MTRARRLLAALALAAFTAVTAAACGPTPHPTYYAPCPRGQGQAGPSGQWECVQ